MRSRTLAILLTASLGIITTACSSSGSSQPVNATTAHSTTTAQVECNQGIASGANVTAQLIKTCNIVSVPTSYPCKHAPNVSEIALPAGDSALLRVGIAPKVYTSQTFNLSETFQLCGDPITSGLTPPMAPLAQSQVKALFQSSASPTTTPVPTSTTVATTSPVATSASCVSVYAQYGGISGNSGGTIPAPIATAVADACSPTDIGALVAPMIPSATPALVQSIVTRLEGLICPTNPHTKLCP